MPSGDGAADPDQAIDRTGLIDHLAILIAAAHTDTEDTDMSEVPIVIDTSRLGTTNIAAIAIDIDIKRQPEDLIIGDIGQPVTVGTDAELTIGIGGIVDMGDLIDQLK